MPRVIPFGDRILCKKKKVGQKLGTGVLVAPEDVADRDTDLATVVHIPDNSFADEELITNAEEIIKGLGDKATAGDSDALVALLQFRTYLNIKSLKKGDDVMIGKYVGTTFYDSEAKGELTLCTGDQIIGKVEY